MKKIKILFVILAFSGLFTACQDNFFELQRPQQNPWNSVEEFERAAIGAYWSIFWGTSDGWNNPWVNLTLVKVSSGDDVDWVNSAEWGYWRKTKEFNRYTDRGWFEIYRTIAGANNALEFVDTNNGDPFPKATESDKKNNVQRIVGELHFMRAYAYYMLQTTFGHAYVPGTANDKKDIPLITIYAKTAEDARTPKIGTTNEIYEQIVSDLVKAKELLPKKFDPATMHKSYEVRATKYAASAMLMRAYIQMGDYVKAKAECDFLIDQNEGEFNLSEDPIAAWNKSELGRGKEVIFYIPFYDDKAYAPLHLTVLNSNAGGWGKCGWCETRMGNSTIKRIGWMTNPDADTTLNMEAKRDKRFTQLMAIRYPKSLAKAGQDTDDRGPIAEKTTIWPNKSYRGPKDFKTNYPLIRLAEVYLTRSIIRFKSGDKQGAADDLNVVRKRAWDNAVGGDYVDITSANITEQRISDERLIEMFGENDRIDYLRAIKADIPNGERSDGVVPYTSEDVVWVVPQRELNYNESYNK